MSFLEPDVLLSDSQVKKNTQSEEEKQVSSIEHSTQSTQSLIDRDMLCTEVASLQHCLLQLRRKFSALT